MAREGKAMMTELVFRSEPYKKAMNATVLESGRPGRIVLDRTVFYAAGGGQPGDTGRIDWPNGTSAVVDAVKADSGRVELVLADDDPVPPVGADILQTLDWDRRYKHMRMHTALHLLSVVIPLAVTGGSVGADKSRLDFNMPNPPSDKAALESELNELIARNLTVSEVWITDEELAANPGLVKTMSVMPPTGTGKVRLIRIADEGEQVDLQPCGGTHVAKTGEIGAIRFGKIENKGRQNRRVNLHLA